MDILQLFFSNLLKKRFYYVTHCLPMSWTTEIWSQQSTVRERIIFFCQLLSISKLLRIYSTTKDILQSDNSILLKNRSFYRNRTSHLHVGYLGMDHNNKNQKCWSKILQESKDWKGIHLHHPDNFYLHSNTYFHDIVTRLWQYVYKW